MSFNPVMALLTQAVGPLCGERPSVLEFGNQSSTAGAATLKRIVARGAQLKQEHSRRAPRSVRGPSQRDRTRN